MRSIMENATHPERVHATVCQQIKTREEACLQKDTPHPEQVKTLTVPFFQVWLSAMTRPQHMMPYAAALPPGDLSSCNGHPQRRCLPILTCVPTCTGLLAGTTKGRPSPSYTVHACPEQ